MTIFIILFKQCQIVYKKMFIQLYSYIKLHISNAYTLFKAFLHQIVCVGAQILFIYLKKLKYRCH